MFKVSLWRGVHLLKLRHHFKADPTQQQWDSKQNIQTYKALRILFAPLRTLTGSGNIHDLFGLVQSTAPSTEHPITTTGLDFGLQVPDASFVDRSHGFSDSLVSVIPSSTKPAHPKGK